MSGPNIPPGAPFNGKIPTNQYGQNGLTLKKLSGIVFGLCRPIRTIQPIGNSITALNTAIGLDFGQTVNVTGVGGTGVHVYASMSCPTGTGTLTYTKASNTLTWTAPGDTAGPAMVAVDGIFALESGTAGAALTVPITTRNLPATDKTDSLVSGTRFNRRLSGCWLGVIDAFTGGRFKFLPNLGIGGNYSSDIAKRIGQALSADADAYLIEAGTNDVVAATLSPAAAVASIVANWDTLLVTGKPVLATLIPPRNDVTVAVNEKMQATNKGLIDAASIRPGVYLIDCYSKILDATSATGAALTGMLFDGVHPGSGGALEFGDPGARILNVLAPDDRVSQNIGLATNYDAVNNPGGNLFNTVGIPNQGAFALTGGTPGTGATAAVAWAATTVQAALTCVIANGNLYYTPAGGTTGTTAPSHTAGDATDGSVIWRFLNSGASVGLGTGWTMGRSTGSALTCVASKYADPNGGPAWQQFTCLGAAVDYEKIRIFSTAPSVANFTAGAPMDYWFDFDVSGLGCSGITAEILLTGGNLPTWDAFHLQDLPQGLRTNGQPGRFKFNRLDAFPASVTGVQPRIAFGSKAGAVFSIRFRNVDLHKVVAA